MFNSIKYNLPLIFLFLLVAVIIVVFFVLLHGFLTTDWSNWEYNYQPTLDRYEQFETQCLTREYTKDQCLLIWSGK